MQLTATAGFDNRGKIAHHGPGAGIYTIAEDFFWTRRNKMVNQYHAKKVNHMDLRRDELGSALLTVFLVVIALTLLGVGLMQYAMTGYGQEIRSERRTMAYYVARSGVDAFVSYVVDNPDNLSLDGMGSLIDIAVSAGQSAPTPLGEGQFAISLAKHSAGGGPDEVVVTSQGTVKGVTETVRRSIILTPGGSAMPPVDCAVFSLGDITLTGSSKIIGQVGTNAGADPEDKSKVDFAWSTGVYRDSEHAPQPDGELLIGPGGVPSNVVHAPSGSPMDKYVKAKKVQNLDKTRSYAMPEFPTYPALPNKGSYTAGWWPEPPYSITEADGDGWYSKLTVESTLNIYVGSGTRRIRADHLSITGSGKINIIGSGNLILYVGKFTLTGGSKVNENGSEKRLHMYYSGTDKLSVPGDTKFRGSVFAQRASVDIGGSGGIMGHIITGGPEVNITGDASANVRVLYAPNAHVKLTGSGKVHGALIGKTVSLEGNTRVFWQEPPDSQGGLPDFGSAPASYARGLWH